MNNPHKELGQNDDSRLDEKLVDDWANDGNKNIPTQKEVRQQRRQEALQLAERILAELRG